MRRVEDARHPGAHGRIGGQIPGHQFGVPQDGRQDVVEVVRDAADQRAERFELLRLAQLGLERQAHLLGLPPLGDVLHRPERDGGAAIGVVTRLAALVDVLHPPVCHQQPMHQVIRDALFHRRGVGAVDQLAVVGMHARQEGLVGGPRRARVELEEAIDLL